MTRAIVLGTGMQGVAAAYDLAAHGGARELALVDSDAERLAVARDRLEALAGVRAEVHRLDVGTAEGRAGLAALLAGADLCMNCLPYRFALEVTRAALAAGCPVADLGGNTAVAREQLALAAQQPGPERVAVLPDCGLMPGMGNLFAAHALAELGTCDSIAIRCGGLPVDPRPPLDYMLLFDAAGLVNEYFGRAQVLRGGELVEVETFTGLERVAVPGLPTLEAFVTSGGLSTTPWTFRGRVRDLDYKTARYVGHHARFQLLLDLGLLDEEPVEVRGPAGEGAGASVRVAPRAVLEECLRRSLAFPGDADLAFLRVTARRGDAAYELEVLDHADSVTGFSAMERTTGFAAAAVAAGVLAGKVDASAGPIEAAVDTAWFLEALALRGIEVTERRGAAVLGGRRA